ncbi:YjfB family protein [Clostridium sp.]|uniref:YjfB family protein n=1 Tax=Clostridium sp. TaxID=1506 RepID=UPI001A3A5204|nr:YjfB family protein [Clostridium sp.]MBK5237084.1 YjfB family protein [Clostridium sp.]
MDIAALQNVMSQPKIQQHASTVALETTKDIEKEHGNPILDKIRNDAIDANIGQNLDAIADKQMDKKDELHKQQQQEMKWARERQIMLNVKETKLLQMRSIAEQGKQLNSLTPLQLRKLNHRLDKLAAQVSAIDSDSRRIKGGKKLE